MNVRTHTSASHGRPVVEDRRRHELVEAVEDVLNRDGDEVHDVARHVRHEFRVEVRADRKHCGERAETSCEEDEEGQLLLRVDRQLVDSLARQQLAVDRLAARRVRVEEVALFERLRQRSEGALPRALQQAERALHLLPVFQMEEAVRDGLAVAALEHVLGRQDERLHLEEVLRYVRVELDCAVNGVDGAHLGRVETRLGSNVRRELVGDLTRLEQGGRVADGGRLGQTDVVVLGEDGLHVSVRLRLEQCFDQVLVQRVQVRHGKLLHQILEQLDRLLRLAQASRAHGEAAFDVDEDVGVASVHRLLLGRLKLHLLALAVRGLGTLVRSTQHLLDVEDLVALLLRDQDHGGGAQRVLDQRLMRGLDASLRVALAPRVLHDVVGGQLCIVVAREHVLVVLCRQVHVVKGQRIIVLLLRIAIVLGAWREIIIVGH